MKSRQRNLIVPFSIAAAMAAAGAAWSQQSVRPGYWETVDQVLSPISSTKTERRCITPADVAKFMSCHINHHYECTCPEQSASAGKIVFKGRCIDHKGQQVDIEGAGVFTPTTLQMKARARFRLLGLPIDADATTEAHRISDTCPAGSTGGPPPGSDPETFR
jgi:hypothetical protein